MHPTALTLAAGERNPWQYCRKPQQRMDASIALLQHAVALDTLLTHVPYVCKLLLLLQVEELHAKIAAQERVDAANQEVQVKRRQTHYNAVTRWQDLHAA
jgi:hypothetical protein